MEGRVAVCPTNSASRSLQILPHEPQEDLDQLCMLAEQAQQFSPIVGIETLDKKVWAGRTLHQPECLLLDVTGLAGHFGGEQGLLEKVADWLYSQNYFGCMAIASTIGAAWALANYSTRRPPKPLNPPSNIPDTIAGQPDRDTDPLKSSTFPSQFCIADTQSSNECLDRLPISGLRLELETVRILRRLGIDTIGQLQQLPRAGIATRLGQALLDRWDQLIGQKPESIIGLHQLPEWQIEHTLDHPTEQWDAIGELIRRMMANLAGRLLARSQGAMRIVCRLDLVESPSLILQLGLFRPTADAEHLQTLLLGQLEQQLRLQPESSLWRLSIQATLTAPLTWYQADLFDGDAAENRHQMARLIDNLSGRLGRRQVLSAKVLREPQPEDACSVKPMTGRRVDGTEEGTLKKLSTRLARRRAEPSVEDPMRRPSRLLMPPVPIAVVADQGMPGQFEYQRQRFQIFQHWGPERLESGWWRGPSIRRDYFRVESEHGAWWWIFRDLQSGNWFLHGIFD